MIRPILLASMLIGLVFTSCKESNKSAQQGVNTSSKHDSIQKSDSILYQTENLIVHRLSEHVFVHESFLNTETFGRVSCNGMLVINENEAIIFDTPTDDESSNELISFITKDMNCKIKAIVPTHFHADCVGGLKTFHDNSIPSFASGRTIALLQKKNSTIIPLNDFGDTLSLNVGNKKVYVEFFGEGHTKDNVIGYFPEDKAVFGGCLIKEVGAGKGNLEDANVQAWSETVTKLKEKYPDAEVVIPGHGKSGGVELLDYTIALFEQ